MRRVILLITVLYITVCGCTEKKYFTGDNLVLEFSVDTVYFDTVFTTIGTSTRELRVINNNSRWIKIDEINLSLNNSFFRLNIDGVSGNIITDIEIAPGDSIFIFIDALIDPNSSNSPVAINDSIIFLYNNNSQDINILAWGQDIRLIDGEEILSQTWNNEKPYVVYNSMMVDTGEVLTIGEGTRILFHRGSTMYVAGTLLVEGSASSRVLFSSDRVEELYDDIPGQWEGIYFLNGSQNNRIENADIINAVSAIHMGNIGTVDPAPDLTLINSKILHNSVTGISSLGASIEAFNCVITHCGFYSLYLVMGGSYKFTHCSVNSYWDYSIRTSPGILISDFIEYNNTIYKGELDQSVFLNSSLTGSLSNEIGIYSSDESILNCHFNNCLLSIDEELSHWTDYDLTGSIITSDAGYISVFGFDLRPDTLSLLIDRADPLISMQIELDIRGFGRFEDNGPDIGAYERQLGEY